MDVAEGFRTCPHCGEQIRAEAVLCRYCRQQIADAPSVVRARRRKKVTIACLAAAIGLVGVATAVRVRDPQRFLAPRADDAFVSVESCEKVSAKDNPTGNPGMRVRVRLTAGGALTAANARVVLVDSAPVETEFVPIEEFRTATGADALGTLNFGELEVGETRTEELFVDYETPASQRGEPRWCAAELTVHYEG